MSNTDTLSGARDLARRELPLEGLRVLELGSLIAGPFCVQLHPTGEILRILDEARTAEIVRGPNIVPPPEGRPLPEALEGRVVIVVEDDVSTGDMAPDGAPGMSLWSNIPECA